MIVSNFMVAGRVREGGGKLGFNACVNGLISAVIPPSVS